MCPYIYIYLNSSSVRDASKISLATWSAPANALHGTPGNYCCLRCPSLAPTRATITATPKNEKCLSEGVSGGPFQCSDYTVLLRLLLQISSQRLQLTCRPAEVRLQARLKLPLQTMFDFVAHSYYYSLRYNYGCCYRCSQNVERPCRHVAARLQ